METNERNDIYNFYKKQYVSGIILFRVSSRYYESYGSDAQILYELASRYNFQAWLEDGGCRIEEKQCAVVMNAGISVHIISHIDKDGNFALPKVNQIIQDQLDDY